MKAWAKAFYHSNAWLECRGSYISSLTAPLCERHLARDEIVPGFIVHHKIDLTPTNINDPTIALNHENLEFVCLDCHNAEHAFGQDTEVTRPGLRFNDDGQLVEVQR